MGYLTNDCGSRWCSSKMSCYAFFKSRKGIPFPRLKNISVINDNNWNIEWKEQKSTFLLYISINLLSFSPGYCLQHYLPQVHSCPCSSGHQTHSSKSQTMSQKLNQTQNSYFTLIFLSKLTIHCYSILSLSF